MNYMTQKTEKLAELATARGLDIDNFKNESNGQINRKNLCDALRALDIDEKKPIDQPVLEEEDGKRKTQEQITTKAVQIMFYSTEENDMPYVQLGLNGRCLYVPKEVAVWIPHEFVEGCLRNAVMTKMKMDIDNRGNIRYIPKQVPRFQYNILDIKDVNSKDE